MVGENIDYVVVKNANAIGEKNITDTVDGTFLGTQSYFFFIPKQKGSMSIQASGNVIEKTEYFYKGMKTDEYIFSRLNEVKSIKEIENEVINEIAVQSEGVRVLEIGKLNRFKVQANFFGSAVIYNMKDTKVGWKPFSLKFGKKKKAIKAFYSTNVKYVEK